jgi:hypothetical protein
MTTHRIGATRGIAWSDESQEAFSQAASSAGRRSHLTHDWLCARMVNRCRSVFAMPSTRGATWRVPPRTRIRRDLDSTEQRCPCAPRAGFGAAWRSGLTWAVVLGGGRQRQGGLPPTGTLAACAFSGTQLCHGSREQAASCGLNGLAGGLPLGGVRDQPFIPETLRPRPRRLGSAASGPRRGCGASLRACVACWLPFIGHWVRGVGARAIKAAPC